MTSPKCLRHESTHVEKIYETLSVSGKYKSKEKIKKIGQVFGEPKRR